MIALCAQYHARAEGRRANATDHATLGEDIGPPRPITWARASAVSRSRRSLTARHQGLPGVAPPTGLSSPRRSCQPTNARAARRYGRCSSGRPGAASYRERISASRPAGSSRTEATWSAAYSAAVAMGFTLRQVPTSSTDQSGMPARRAWGAGRPYTRAGADAEPRSGTGGEGVPHGDRRAGVGDRGRRAGADRALELAGRGGDGAVRAGDRAGGVPRVRAHQGADRAARRR